MAYSIDFKEMYLNYDFDAVLLEQNNNLVNSNSEYLDIKNNYLQQTNDNFNKFTELTSNHTELSNNRSVIVDENLTTHLYTFINNQDLHNTNVELKVLLQNQRYLFENFIHYISFINSTEIIGQNVYHGDINQPQTIKINNKKKLNFI